jgi:hypothetical protein
MEADMVETLQCPCSLTYEQTTGVINTQTTIMYATRSNLSNGSEVEI